MPAASTRSIRARDEVLGERAWPSLAALPEIPEHAYIVASTDATMEAIEECARIGVPVVTALANGFTETGAEGTAREARIRRAPEGLGTRLVGPSSLGVVDLRHKTFLTANAAFDEPDLPVGRIFAASHSGGMIGTFLSRGKARGIHFAGLVSVGNEVDLSIGEICEATLDDPGIDGYVLFLETMRKAEALRAFALEAAMRGKPVLAYKLGRSAAARELAVSHTGALAGEDDIAGMFLAEMRHRPRRHAGRSDRGLPAADSRAGTRSRRAAAECRRGDDHRRRRHHGGRSARHARHRGRTADAADLGADQGSHRRRRDAGAADRSDARRRAVQGDEGRARRADDRAGVRSGRGRGRLVGAVLSRSCGQADHRQRRRRQADRGVSRARSARRAGAARRSGRAEFPHAGGLRRCHRGSAAAARAAADRGAVRPIGRRGPDARRTRSLCAAEAHRRAARAVGRA